MHKLSTTNSKYSLSTIDPRESVFWAGQVVSNFIILKGVSF